MSVKAEGGGSGSGSGSGSDVSLVLEFNNLLLSECQCDMVLSSRISPRNDSGLNQVIPVQSSTLGLSNISPGSHSIDIWCMATDGHQSCSPGGASAATYQFRCTFDGAHPSSSSSPPPPPPPSFTCFKRAHFFPSLCHAEPSHIDFSATADSLLTTGLSPGVARTAAPALSIVQVSIDKTDSADRTPPPPRGGRLLNFPAWATNILELVMVSIDIKRLVTWMS